MKHLKIYEDYHSDLELQGQVLDWMKTNKLEEVDLSGMGILKEPSRQQDPNEFNPLRNVTGYEFNLIKPDKNGELTIYFNQISSSYFIPSSIKIKNFNNSKYLEAILEYLKGLTEEEIDQMKSDQESEKFNI